MRYLLNLAYLGLLAITSPWLVYQSIRTGKYRDGWSAKFFGRVSCPDDDRPTIWLHAVSVGEVNLVSTMMDELRRRFPGHAFVVTATTRTGFELASKRFAEHTVSYAPLDFSWAVAEALDRIRPSMLVLVELELWPNLIRTASARGASVAIVNGRLSENSFRGYQRLERLTGLVSKLLRCVDLVAAQNATCAERFRTLGAPCVEMTGSVKFDGAETDRANSETTRLASLGGYDANHRVFLAGSTQDPEESMALATFLALRDEHPDLRLIVVPRHPERFDEVAAICEAANVRFARRSQWQEEFGKQPVECPEVLLVDTVGELSAWWGVADVAFVGGSMGSRGGQNMIEPAAFGAAVSFGPNTKNFRDVTSMLLEGDAAVVVNDGAAMKPFVERCLVDRQYATELGSNAQQLVVAGRGATETTVRLLGSLIADTSSLEPARVA